MQTAYEEKEWILAGKTGGITGNETGKGAVWVSGQCSEDAAYSDNHSWVRGAGPAWSQVFDG